MRVEATGRFKRYVVRNGGEAYVWTEDVRGRSAWSRLAVDLEPPDGREFVCVHGGDFRLSVEDHLADLPKLILERGPWPFRKLVAMIEGHAGG